MMMRLETVAKELAAKLRLATPTQQRAASLVACQFALQAAPIEASIVSEALEQLRQQGELSQQRIAELSDLVAQLDEKYFDLQDKAKDNASLQAEMLRLFGQARAVSALSFAGGRDALAAAMEAIYEASATVDADSKIYEAVLLALNKFHAP
jgi:uncharacterized protein YigA (DUF484 family)